MQQVRVPHLLERATFRWDMCDQAKHQAKQAVREEKDRFSTQCVDFFEWTPTTSYTRFDYVVLCCDDWLLSTLAD
jgi:hypothetical protein